MNKQQELLQQGLIIGTIVTRLEENETINFTCNQSYDDEFLKLAEQLIGEWESPAIKKHSDEYFSDFVERRLIELDKEFNIKEKSKAIEKLLKNISELYTDADLEKNRDKINKLIINCIEILDN